MQPLIKRLFNFQSVTIAAAFQFWLVIKLFPTDFIHYGHVAVFTAVFFFNYCFLAIFWFAIYPRFFSPLRHLQGPRPLISVARRAQVKDGGLQIYLDLFRLYPDQSLINLNALGNQVLIVDPRLLPDLLVHRCYDFGKPKKTSTLLRRVLGENGLVIVEGAQHKFLRKNTMPAFHFRHIKELYPMMWNKANLFTKTLRKEVGDRIINDPNGTSIIELSSWASKVTLDIIGIAGLGRNFNTIEKGHDPLQQVYESLLEPSKEKIIFSLLYVTFGSSLVRLLPWRMNRVFDNLTTSLEDICRPMMTEKRDAITKNHDDHFDILSLLIKSNNFSDTELKDQLLTFLAAGHETTASALTWASYLLAKAPQIQQTLRDEVFQTLSLLNAEDEPTELAEILEKLPYLNGVIMETLRLYPTVPLTMREAFCDTQIGEQFIPEGTIMVVSIWLINRSPTVWGADAENFRPERWISDDGKPNQNGGALSNYDFMTFLHGPRSCIGQNFAKAEMRCLLAAMVQAFSWDLATNKSKIIPRGVITIKPESGMYLRLNPLDQVSQSS